MKCLYMSCHVVRYRYLYDGLSRISDYNNNNQNASKEYQAKERVSLHPGEGELIEGKNAQKTENTVG